MFQEALCKSGFKTELKYAPTANQQRDKKQKNRKLSITCHLTLVKTTHRLVVIIEESLSEENVQ